MMGSLGQAQNDTESIAQFMQRLSQATNIFISPEDPTGKSQPHMWIMFIMPLFRIVSINCYLPVGLDISKNLTIQYIWVKWDL